jgi:perosamine synthetase
MTSKRLFGNEARYVLEVLDTEFRSSQGSLMTRRLEELFAKAFSTEFAIAFVNGTATMHALLEARDIGPGDEVIVPPLTMSATTFAVLQCNATPIFADIDPDTFEISANSIAERITPRTKAIIPVALYGLSPDMDPIMAFAQNHGLFVIEDAAQCFLGQYRGRRVGTLGHAASFSLQSSKHITSGEGGMVITNDPELADRARKVQSLGYAGVGAKKGKISKLDIQEPSYERHVTMGWNYRMSELCAGVALAQLENIEALVNTRIEAANRIDAAVRECNWLIPQRVPEGSINSYWTYVVQLRHPDLTWIQVRDKFRSLGGDGIYGAWQLTYLEPMFKNLTLLGRERFISPDVKKNYRRGLCPVAEDVQPRLMQFKTNYWDLKDAERQAEILHDAIRALS